jgi:hypothetical protein
VTDDDLREFVSAESIDAFIACSAKTGEGTDEVFPTAVDLCNSTKKDKKEKCQVCQTVGFLIFAINCLDVIALLQKSRMKKTENHCISGSESSPFLRDLKHRSTRKPMDFPASYWATYWMRMGWMR